MTIIVSPEITHFPARINVVINILSYHFWNKNLNGYIENLDPFLICACHPYVGASWYRIPFQKLSVFCSLKHTQTQEISLEENRFKGC